VTIDDLRRSSLSTTVKQWWIGILNATGAASVTTASAVEPAITSRTSRTYQAELLSHPTNELLSVDQESKSQTGDPSMGRLSKGVFTSAYAPTRQSQDTRFEQETTIAANSCLDVCNPQYFSAYIKFNPDYTLNNVRATLWVTNEWAGNQQLPLPAARTLAADPVLAVNPYSGGYGGSAYRSYIVGTNYGPPSNSSGIVVEWARRSGARGRYEHLVP
jgi:hypothetical protein